MSDNQGHRRQMMDFSNAIHYTDILIDCKNDALEAHTKTGKNIANCHTGSYKLLATAASWVGGVAIYLIDRGMVPQAKAVTAISLVGSLLIVKIAFNDKDTYTKYRNELVRDEAEQKCQTRLINKELQTLCKEESGPFPEVYIKENSASYVHYRMYSQVAIAFAQVVSTGSLWSFFFLEGFSKYPLFNKILRFWPATVGGLYVAAYVVDRLKGWGSTTPLEEDVKEAIRRIKDDIGHLRMYKCLLTKLSPTPCDDHP